MKTRTIQQIIIGIGFILLSFSSGHFNKDSILFLIIGCISLLIALFLILVNKTRK